MDYDPDAIPLDSAGSYRPRPESEILQAYAGEPDPTVAGQNRPSESTDDTRRFSGSADVTLTENMPQSGYMAHPAPPVEAVGTAVPVAEHPLSGGEKAPSSDEQRSGRVRFTSGLDVPQRDPGSGVRPHGTGPTVTARRVPSQGSGNVRTSETGIRRSNHPGFINLAGLRPQYDYMSAPHSDPDESGAEPRTGAFELNEQTDETRHLNSLADELNDLEDENASIAAQRIADQTGHGVVSDSAFIPGVTAPSEHGGSDTDDAAFPGLSASRDPTTGETTSDSSYDPAQDEQLSHVDLVAGETDGMPAPPPRSVRHRMKDAQERGGGWFKLRRFIGIPTDEQKLSEDSEKGLTSGEDGPTNTKSVPVRTSTGVRGTLGRSRPSKLERKAAKLVRNQRIMMGQPAESSDETTPDPEEVSKKRRVPAPDSEASTPDMLEVQDRIDARPVATGGVLGQLLKLYEQQQRGERPAPTSEGTTPASETGTPDIGAGVTVDGENVTDAHGNQVPVESLDPTLIRNLAQGTSEGVPLRSPPTDSEKRRYVSGRPISNYGGAIYGGAQSSSKFLYHGGQKVIKGVANEAGIDVMDERPKAARSSAGVFGALIATTGNLIGAVSPNQAQLGPNPQRPGYTLDRYLLPEMNAKTLRRTQKIIAESGPLVSRSGARGSDRFSPPKGPKVSGESDPFFAGSPSEGKTISPDAKAGAATPISSRPISRAETHAEGVATGVKGTGKNLMARSLKAIPGVRTPDVFAGRGGDYFGSDSEARAKAEWQRKLKKRQKQRKKQEIYITMHVAAILQRQEFLMKLSRALMMFGAPTHRIEQQIQQTANMLDINCRCIYFPNLMIMSFGDDSTQTSDTKVIKQGSVLDLTKLTDMHAVYWKVINDKIGVETASKQLDALMRKKPLIGKLPSVIIGGFASAFICAGEAGFGGTFFDCMAAFVLGAFLIFCQLSITSDVYSSVFEIVFATFNSFISLALHMIHDSKGRYFCYKPVVSASIVMILPGFIVLTAALELQSKNIVAGSVRLVYAIIYVVLLSLGISIGASPLMGRKEDPDDPCSPLKQMYKCSKECRPNYKASKDNKPWAVMNTPSLYWAILTVPGYAVSLSLKNQAKVTRKEFPIMVAIAIAGWAVSHSGTFLQQTINTKTRKGQPIAQKMYSARTALNQPYLVAALGSFVVGILANIYGRFSDGRSFVVAVPGILYQLPTGLTNTAGGNSGTLFNSTAANSSSSSPGLALNSSNITNGFETGQQLLSVSLGITIGLFSATILMYMLGGRKIRGGGLFSF